MAWQYSLFPPRISATIPALVGATQLRVNNAKSDRDTNCGDNMMIDVLILVIMRKGRDRYVTTRYEMKDFFTSNDDTLAD